MSSGRNRQSRWKEGYVHVPNCKSFLVTDAERKHVGQHVSLVAVACFLPGRAKDLPAHLYIDPAADSQHAHTHTQKIANRFSLDLEFKKNTYT